MLETKKYLENNMSRETAYKYLLGEANKKIHMKGWNYSISEIRASLFAMLSGACPDMRMEEGFDLVQEIMRNMDTVY